MAEEGVGDQSAKEAMERPHGEGEHAANEEIYPPGEEMADDDLPAMKPLPPTRQQLLEESAKTHCL